LVAILFAGFFTALALFFTGLAWAFVALGPDAFFAGFLEFVFLAELAINLGDALGLLGASGGLLKNISSRAQGEISPLKTL
jgi:hypothetical protein